MAAFSGDIKFSLKCDSLFNSGMAWIDKHLFNGQYYVHDIRMPENMESLKPDLYMHKGIYDKQDPAFQLGKDAW
jgi:hypothetical protein